MIPLHQAEPLGFDPQPNSQTKMRGGIGLVGFNWLAVGSLAGWLESFAAKAYTQ